jgi:hypothetical protein
MHPDLSGWEVPKARREYYAQKTKPGTQNSADHEAEFRVSRIVVAIIAILFILLLAWLGG